MVERDLKCIFGNEIGIILGINTTRTIKELYEDKLKKGQSRHESLREKYEAMYWINTIKEILCKEFTIIDEEYDFMRSKVDRRIVGENSILLCSIYSGINPSEGINESILLECQHNMRVTKADKCYVACLINDRRFIFKEVCRDEEVISNIIKEEKTFFYNHLQKEISPV